MFFLIGVGIFKITSELPVELNFPPTLCGDAELFCKVDEDFDLLSVEANLTLETFNEGMSNRLNLFKFNIIMCPGDT